MGKTYCLIDGSGYIFRAFYALPPMNRSDGVPINAVYGFTNMLFQVLKDNNPPSDYSAVIFDAKRKNFRNDIYSKYKANRLEPPEELVPQFSIIRDAVEAFNVPSYEMEGYEADDLIATFANKIVKNGDDVIVITSDKDLLQLLSDKIKIYDPMKRKYLKEEDCIKKFGVTPDKVIDVQSLMGDSVDNIPGVKGIGVKTAAKLINEFGGLDSLLENAEKVSGKSVKEKLIQGKDDALMSRKLVSLDKNAPIEINFDELKHDEIAQDQLLEFIDDQEFKSLRSRVESFFKNKDKNPNPLSNEKNNYKSKENDKENRDDILENKKNNPEDYKNENAKIDYDKYEIVDTLEQLKVWIENAKKQGYAAVDTESTNLNPHIAQLVGVSMAISSNQACYIPLQHKKHLAKEDLFDDNSSQTDNAKLKQINFDEAIPILKEFFEDESIMKIGHNIKYDMHILSHYNIKVFPYHDTMVMSYVLDNALHKHNLDDLSYFYFKHENLKYSDLCGSGKNEITFNMVDIKKAAPYAAEDADMTFRLFEILKQRLINEKMQSVYENLDKSLVKVLYQMEQNGIKADISELKTLSAEFGKKMSRLENEIYNLAGEHFNIGSPKQLGEVLFEKMKIDYSKRKTKSGAYRTDVGILEDLAIEGYEIAQKIIDWRGLSKLKNTYSDALINDINPKTRRIHSSFMQTVVLSGRLASSNPNMQNIPIRTEDGRKIRKAFIPENGNKLISADYSQIELRIMAEVANVSKLKDAFKNGKDVHKATASKIFSVSEDAVTSDQRRIAKTVNFSLIFGSSHYGLARNLGIKNEEAKSIIDAYFKSYPEILEYMEEQKQKAAIDGYVTTMLGRKCFITGTSNPRTKTNAERVAINAPIQGTEADIMKIAMINLHKKLKEDKYKTKMLIQVHDELVFETPENEIEDVIQLIKETMENAGEKISTILPVDIGIGNNWDEAH